MHHPTAQPPAPTPQRTRRALLAGAAALWLLGGLVTRAADAKPPAFEKEIQAFEAADAAHPPPRDAILFVGSSTIRLWTNLPSAFPGKKVIARGFGGSQMSDLLLYTDRIVLPYHPRHILVYEGDNDLAAGRSPEEIVAGYREFVSRVRAALPSARISVIAIKPSRARWNLLDRIRTANRLLSEFAGTQRRMEVIDTFSATLDARGELRAGFFKEDGLHLNATGYEAWAKVIAPRL